MWTGSHSNAAADCWDWGAGSTRRLRQMVAYMLKHQHACGSPDGTAVWCAACRHGSRILNQTVIVPPCCCCCCCAAAALQQNDGGQPQQQVLLMMHEDKMGYCNLDGALRLKKRKRLPTDEPRPAKVGTDWAPECCSCRSSMIKRYRPWPASPKLLRTGLGLCHLCWVCLLP